MMGTKLLRFLVRSSPKICQSQLVCKYGHPAPSNQLHGASSNFQSANKFFSSYIPETAVSCLTGVCLQANTWHRPQVNFTTAAKTVNNWIMDISSPSKKQFCAARAAKYQHNPKCLRKLTELPVQYYSVLSPGKIMPKQSIVPAKRPPKASRTKQPSRANLPLLSETEVQYKIFMVCDFKGSLR